MSGFKLSNFKELIDLIPNIQNSVTIGMEREIKEQKDLVKKIKYYKPFLSESSPIFRGKWTADILYVLFFLEKAYFNDIKKALKNINSRTLTDRLRLLEEKKIINRIVHSERPVRVSYELTKFGQGLIKLLIPILFYLLLNSPKLIKE